VTAPLRITIERDSYVPGELIEGAVEVLEPAKDRKLLLALEYRDRTADHEGVGRRAGDPLVLAQGDLEQGACFRFNIALPVDALPNQAGVYGSATWGLHAQIGLYSQAGAWQPISVSVPPRRSAVG
jgi:hypothetical protein